MNVLIIYVWEMKIERKHVLVTVCVLHEERFILQFVNVYFTFKSIFFRLILAIQAFMLICLFYLAIWAF